jgi:hypothetical protein
VFSRHVTIESQRVSAWVLVTSFNSELQHLKGERTNMSPKNHSAKAKSGLRKSSSPKKRKAATADDEDVVYASEAKKVYDSDALDEDSSEDTKKRKRVRASKKTRSPRKKRREEDEDEEADLQEGQEIVGVVVEAPKTGRGEQQLYYYFRLILFLLNSSTWSNLAEQLGLPNEIEGSQV